MNASARILEETYLPRPEKMAPDSHTVRRKSKKLSKTKFPSLVFILVLGYLAVSFGAQFSKLTTMQKDVLSIQQEVEELKQRNMALRQELQAVQTDAYVEKTAREKLGLVKQGETRVLTVAPGTELQQLEVPSGPTPAAD
ncbi:cell division protein FtsB [Pelotomaculum schinkii]|uniref:Cell division protein FtsB n=1 Tax=Pelotomaculum schinkii TaxID=78350 RepID=A0A4Y7RI54_9FIRM|nr:septum formation initiator family protein [Pelotomaculum schinkii]TEB08382.1 cell division protein FtsB [Pelotomaculum schinkii]